MDIIIIHYNYGHMDSFSSDTSTQERLDKFRGLNYTLNGAPKKIDLSMCVT